MVLHGTSNNNNNNNNNNSDKECYKSADNNREKFHTQLFDEEYKIFMCDQKI